VKLGPGVALLLSIGASPVDAAVAGSPEVPSVQLDGLDAAVAHRLGALRAEFDRQHTAGRADALAYGRLAQHYHAYGLNEAAVAAYRAASALVPDEPRWPYLCALVQIDLNRPGEAADLLEYVLARADKYYPALLRLARLRLNVGDSNGARPLLELARRGAPNDPAQLALSGELAQAEGRAAEAAELFAAALRTEPRATRLHYGLGMAYRALGRGEEARRELAQAGGVGVSPRDPWLEQVLALRAGPATDLRDGHLALRAGDLDSAAAAFERARSAGGDAEVDALVALASIASRRGRQPAALVALERAFELDPNRPTVLYNSGVLLLHAGRAREAELRLAALVERSPEDHEARAAWGQSLLALSRRSDALAALEPLDALPADRCREVSAGLRAAAWEASLSPRATALAARFEQACSGRPTPEVPR